MAIVISRATGERISGELTEQEKQDLAFCIFRAFTDAHPEMIQNAVDEYLSSNPS